MRFKSGTSAPEIMGALPRVTSPNHPETGDFYTFKRVSVEKIANEIKPGGDWAQFGVYKGEMASHILQHLPEDAKLHLADSFEGLPEDWVGPWRAGAFRLEEHEIPAFSDPRVVVHKGWFSDTVPVLAKQLQRPLSFLHIDCDLYSSTKDCLWGLNRHIEKDSVLLFDEYMIHTESGSDDGEHRALTEWTQTFGREVEYLWRTNWMQVAVRVVA